MAKQSKNAKTPRLDFGISGIVRELEAREKAHDKILSESRAIIRRCANSIKMIHAHEITQAKKEIAQMKKELAALPVGAEHEYLLNPIWQESAEAQILLAAIERREIPSHSSLKMPFQPYLLGVCDAIGEFRREMLECLKSGDKKGAQYFFGLMSAAYDELLPLRFSNSVLPNFRKKQDVARMQVEQARSELVRSQM